MRSRLRHRFTIELKFPFTLFVFLCPWWWRANRWKKKIIRNYDYTLFSKYLLDNKTGGIKQNICQNNNIKSNINRSYNEKYETVASFINFSFINCSQHYLMKKGRKVVGVKVSNPIFEFEWNGLLPTNLIINQFVRHQTIFDVHLYVFLSL